MRLIKSSHTEISGASEVPQSRRKFIFQEAQLLCFCSNMASIDIDRMTKYKRTLVQTDDVSKNIKHM